MERALTVSIAISIATVYIVAEYIARSHLKIQHRFVRCMRSIVPCLRITNSVSSVFGKYTGSWLPFQNVFLHSGLH